MEHQRLGPREISRVQDRTSERARVVPDVRGVRRGTQRPQRRPCDPGPSWAAERCRIEFDVVGVGHARARLHQRFRILREHSLEATRLSAEPCERS